MTLIFVPEPPPRLQGEPGLRGIFKISRLVSVAFTPSQNHRSPRFGASRQTVDLFMTSQGKMYPGTKSAGLSFVLAEWRCSNSHLQGHPNMKPIQMKQFVAAAAVVASFGAQAALTTLTPADGWPPLGSSGLQDVLFNVSTQPGAVKVATGAHNYTEGAVMANNGIDTFYGNTGYSPFAPTTNARWALDYVINYGTGTVGDYVTTFSFDIDPSGNESYVNVNLMPRIALPRVYAA